MKKYSYLFLLLIGLFACADLDEIRPINSIPTASAITDLPSAQAALNGVYNSMQNNNFDKWLSLPQYFSDEAEATGTFPSRLEFGNLNVFPANGTASGVFSSLYNTINNANNIIALVPQVAEASFTAEQKADILAQAKFLRAQQYLQLVTLWQEVPLILTPTIEVGEVLNVPTSTVDLIYEQIINDFTESQQQLLAETGTQLASQQAATAFLARIALYQERWSDAFNLATSALGEDFDLTAVPFLEDQIYSLGFTSTDGNVLNFFYGPADFGGRYSISPSTTLIAAFEVGDGRFDQTLDVTTASVPFGVKYPSFESGIAGTATDPIYFIRHAEMVLIAAEAAAEMGDFATANTFYNQVRTRANVAPKLLTASNLVDFILAERFVEFAFEGAFRLLDLRRKGKAMEVLGPIGYDSCDEVWPLPQREVDRNSSLQQNGCCNC